MCVCVCVNVSSLTYCGITQSDMHPLHRYVRVFLPNLLSVLAGTIAGLATDGQGAGPHSRSAGFCAQAYLELMHPSI